MRIKLLYLIIFSLLPIFIHAQESISLEQCYTWARNNYPTIKQFDLISQAEECNIDNAAKAWIPQFSIGGKATYQSDVTELPFQEELDKFGIENPDLDKDQYKIAAEINQQIWDGGLYRNQKKLAQASADAEEKKIESSLYAIRERVNELFFGCLIYDELLRQNLLLSEQLHNNHKRIESMLANGIANMSDLQLIEVELLQTEQQKIEYNAANETYRMMLSQLVGKNITAETILLLPQEELNLSNEILRPEIETINAHKEIFNRKEKLLNTDYFPKFGLFVQGGYGRPALNLFDDSFTPYAIGGISLSWNISNLYSHNDKRELLAIDKSKLDIELETFLFNTRLEVLKQQMEIKKFVELKKYDEKILQLRTDVRETAEVKQSNGVFSTSDLIKEINAESMARQQLSVRNILYIACIHKHLHITGNGSVQTITHE